MWFLWSAWKFSSNLLSTLVTPSVALTMANLMGSPLCRCFATFRQLILPWCLLTSMPNTRWLLANPSGSLPRNRLLPLWLASNHHAPNAMQKQKLMRKIRRQREGFWWGFAFLRRERQGGLKLSRRLIGVVSCIWGECCYLGRSFYLAYPKMWGR